MAQPITSGLFAKMKYYTYLALLRIRSLFFVFGKIPFVLIIIFIGYYAFAVNDQGLDMMATFGFMSLFGHRYFILFYLFLIVWAGTIWNVSRILLSAANLKRLVEKQIPANQVLPEGTQLPSDLVIVRIDPKYKDYIEAIIKWMPRLLMLCPYLIFLSGFIIENDYSLMNKHHQQNFIITVLFVCVAAILQFAYFVFRRKGKITHNWQGSSVRQALKNERIEYNTLITFLLCIIIFIYAVVAAYSNPVESGRPGIIILSALIVYTFAGLIINLIINQYKIPIFILMVVFAIFVAARFNNNHAIQTLKSPADHSMMSAREKVKDSVWFSRWLDGKMATGIYDTGKNDNTIFIVAAEGGGIRNCYWTFTVLKNLQNRQPDFYNKTFAVTGASGGSVGLGFYFNYLYHNREKIRANHFVLDTIDIKALDSICSGDYLSRVTFGFLYPDAAQRFLPWAIRRWDRGKFLGDSFDEGYSTCVGKNGEEKKLLSRNYLEMWSGNDFYNYPAILFNSVYDETGSKAVFSPFVLTKKYYADALDILSVTKKSVPMKEGMVSTARFPIITPPGLMMYDTGKDNNINTIKLGHLSDGGGFDNKAIQTAQQTVKMMEDVLAKRKLTKNFRLMIVYTGYGVQPLLPPDDLVAVREYDKAIGSSYELAPVIGGSNTLFRWIFSAHGLTALMDSNMNVVDFGLRASRMDSSTHKHKLPLGWYLSDTSRKLIGNEMNDRRVLPSLKPRLAKFDAAF